jgi:peroxiredoxin
MLILLLLTGLALASSPVGQAVPNFTLYNLNGEGRTLRQIAPGKPIALVVWCSSCASCRGVEGDIDRLASDTAGRAVVMALDANRPETKAGIQAALDRKGLKFPVWLDRDGKVVEHYGIKTTTTTLVVDAQGRLRYLGHFGDGMGRKALEQVLEGKEVSPTSSDLIGCPVVRR